jgi:hypothetical protein
MSVEELREEISIELYLIETAVQEFMSLRQDIGVRRRRSEKKQRRLSFLGFMEELKIS